jgi:predicted DNA-binding mobile mystery protein A
MDKHILARKALDKRLKPLRSIPMQTPPRGWLRAIREALGMTTRQMAERLGVSQPRITALEKAEAGGSVTLQSLRDAAQSLDCTLVYAIVPNDSLDALVRQQATMRADEELRRLNHTMRLENQALTPDDLSAERARLITEFVHGAPRRLWEKL